MDKFVYLNDVLCGISVYSDVAEDEVVAHFRSMIKNIVSQNPDFNAALADYRDICHTLYHSEYKGCLPDYLFDKILISNNIYTLYCANSAYSMVPTVVKTAVSFDLNSLYILSQLTCKHIKARLTELFCAKESIINLLPSYINEAKKFNTNDSWGNCLTMLADFHRKNGMGIFAKYDAVFFSNGKLKPIESINPICLKDIDGYDEKKQIISSNTQNFISKKPAEHLALYGNPKISKSAFVAALSNEYREQGLRMIQISSADAEKLYNIMEDIRDIPLRFIIFIEDLTFEALKSIKRISASLYLSPENTLIYTTADRFSDKITAEILSQTFNVTVNFND